MANSHTPQAPANLQKPDPAKVQAMFAQVAKKYDSANTVLSFGIHHLWRRKLVNWSDVKTGDAVLDCATGTGDLAIAFKKRVGTEGKVFGTDFCAEMLDSAPAKAKAAGLDIEFALADVTKLQYPDKTFNVASISFGIRNVEDRVQGIKEMARVCKPGGRVMILEFGQVQTPGFKQVYDFYSSSILPRIGGMVTGQKEAYDYLQKSSAAFPSGEDFIQMMASTHKFSSLNFKRIMGGVAYIYKGVVK